MTDNPCYVIHNWPHTCDRGTAGCDGCERCICHGCYSHAEDTGCQCEPPAGGSS